MKTCKWSLVLTFIGIFVISGCDSSTTLTATPQPEQTTPAPVSCPTLTPDVTTILINDKKTVTLALPKVALVEPESSGLILQVVPLQDAPTEDESGLNCQDGIIIGVLIAQRDLPFSDEQMPKLPVGKYLVKIQLGQMIFINSNSGEEFTSSSLIGDTRTILTRDVTPPEAIITIKDICYSWHHVQVCTPLSPSIAFSEEENKIIQETMQKAVDLLKAKGFLEGNEINVPGTLPDMEGEIAQNLQQASLLAAPTVNFPSDKGDVPVNDALLGVVVALEDIAVNGYPTVPAGIYAVRAKQAEGDKWQGHFIRDDGIAIAIPSPYVEVRGKIEEPLAILLRLRMILCFFECG